MGWVLGAIILLVVLAAWQGHAYVMYSDGVYAESARLVLRGLVPYHDFAAAQPPLLYYAGAAILAFGDSVVVLRAGLALVDFALGLLAVALVLRLTGRRLSAAAAGILVLITPWALNGHAQLVPETFAAPLLLGATLAAADRRWAWLAGALGAGAAAFKVAFLLPALMIALASAGSVSALGALGATLAAVLMASTLAFGGDFWRNAVEAQLQTGTAAFHYVAGLLGQGAWNLLPFLIIAALAFVYRAQASDRVQLRVLVAAVCGSLLLALSLFKNGSYLDVLSVAEPPLVVLGVCGVTWMLGSAARPLTRAIVAACGLMFSAQTISLLASPADPALFGRPFAKSDPGWSLTSAEVDRRLVQIRRCPPGLPFSGRPYLAFAAGRRMPGNQPDVFIIQTAAVDRHFLIAALRDRPWCPGRH